jgi:hypothetical protein
MKDGLILRENLLVNWPAMAGKRLLYSSNLRLFVIVAILSTSFHKLNAQNLENIGRGKAFGLSGGVNANNVFYHANGIENRRNPNNYFLSGNLNLSIYDWSVPISFSYSDQNKSFQQPFNQYGLSPTYKWITLHGGYRSMMFSNYTVSGHLFLGGGFDITPTEKIKVSGFYGRLQKAVEEDTAKQSNLPAYERNGGGVKFTYGTQKDFISAIIFKAVDNRTSLSSEPVYADVTPQENLVLGLDFGTVLLKRLTFKGEVATSAMTKDVRAEAIHAGNLFDKLPFGFNPRASSSYYQAYKSTLQYAMKNVGVGLAYERVDPGYRTLGAYYFNNNLESFSVTSAATLFEKKARVSGQVGVQRNNLNHDQLNTMNRLSGSININYLVSPRLVYNVSYSNFQTVINFRSQFVVINQATPYENMDTLNFRQLSQNANGNVNYVLNESKERRQNVNVNLSYQKTSDEQANIKQPSGADFYNVNSSYTLLIAEYNATINIAANANYTRAAGSENKIYGPTASIRKTYFNKKLSTNATISYNNAYQNDRLTSKVTNLRISGGYTLKEKHQFDLNLTRLNRFSARSETQQRFNELTIQVGYSYNFSID